MRKFVAVDGESFTIDGEHRYVLMGSSSGDSVYNAAGLSTVECFEFLLAQMEGYTVVAYGLNYDVNMILRDLDAVSLVKLWNNHRVRWGDYRLEWVAGKYFSVGRNRIHVQVNDVFGFFQSKFVTALERWGFDAEPEIERMKGLRGEFTPDMLPEVRRYCIAECRLMVKLMTRLNLALLEVELKPTQWVGAGSIGSALMRRNGVQKHRVPDKEFQPAVHRAIMAAYYGGRNELFQQGTFRRLYDYDISSAYPSEALKLPSMKGGRWKKARAYQPLAAHALWYCRWSLKEPVVCPFPYRFKRAIMYPAQGSGWYHAAEVAAALRAYDIDIPHGWVFEPKDDNSPFEFIRETYEHRRRLKEIDHGGEKVLKLGLNSIYGKLAQGLTAGGRRLPPFQSFYWAGAITAGTRARILDLAMRKPGALVMVATDGIFFTEPIDVEVSGGLGGLELSHLDRAFVAQSGVYSHFIDGERHNYTRGFFSDEIDFDALQRGWDAEGANHIAAYESTRFCGLGYSLGTGDLSSWRTWKTAGRKLSLFPATKIPAGYDPDAGAALADPLRLVPPGAPSGANGSEPYEIKRSSHLTDAEASEVVEYLQAMEQPLRVTI